MNTFVPLRLDDTENNSKPNPEQPLLEHATTEEKIIVVIKTIFDPEISVNIYDLGLIYSVLFNAETQKAEIVMTLTSPGCFAAGMIPGEVEQAALSVPEVLSVNVELTFEPPWDKEMMSEVAKVELGFW